MDWMMAVGMGRFAANTLYYLSQGQHFLVTFWNNGAHGPVSDFFTVVGHTTVHVVKDAGRGIAHVYCKGKSIEVPITKNGVDVSSCR